MKYLRQQIVVKQQLAVPHRSLRLVAGTVWLIEGVVAEVRAATQRQLTEEPHK